MWAPGVPAWQDVTVIDRRTMSRAALVRRLVREAPRFDSTVINGSARFHELYQDLIAAAVLARRRRPPAIVVAETAWDLGSAPLSKRLGLRGFRLGGVARAGVAAVDGDHVTYCVFSREERDLLAQTFGIPEERIACVRFAHSLWSRADGPTADGGYVFAGGDSLRDWDTLIAAVKDLDVPVRIGTRNELPPLPANVSGGPVTDEEYVELMAGARVVVVPMRDARRGAGLITYLNAMALGKPVIATESPAVHEYVDDGHTGVVVPAGDPRALSEALRWLLDPTHADHREAMGRAARASVSHPTEYWQSLRDVAEAAAQRAH
jgi:glycosyltransferase involved in cell wall biosynthesis